MLVTRIFRKSTPQFHSFERVFSQLKLDTHKDSILRDVYLPHDRADILSIWKNCFFAKNLKSSVFHITGGVHYLVLVLPPCKTLLTIHDTVFLKSGTGFKGWLLKVIFLNFPVRRAKLITAISEKSKLEIIAHTSCNPDKIKVIPNPVDRHIYFKIKVFNCVKTNILFIGSTQFKNLERVLVSLVGIQCTLTLIGIYSKEQVLLIENSGVDVIIRSGLSDSEIADQYAEADIVLFPSLYEGFGLPIIEGQKAGRPVITSNISPMKEVAGLGACLVDPTNVNSIRAGLLKVINDEVYRNGLVDQGFHNVKKYDPEVISRQYNDLYFKLYNTSKVKEVQLIKE